MIDGYSFTLTCPDCPDGGMVHIADGTSTGWDARAIAKCSECLLSWVVSVQLVVAGRMTK